MYVMQQYIQQREKPCIDTFISMRKTLITDSFRDEFCLLEALDSQYPVDSQYIY